MAEVVYVEHLRDESFLFTIEVEEDIVGDVEDVPSMRSTDRCLGYCADELRERSGPLQGVKVSGDFREDPSKYKVRGVQRNSNVKTCAPKIPNSTSAQSQAPKFRQPIERFKKDDKMSKRGRRILRSFVQGCARVHVQSQYTKMSEVCQKF